MTVNAVIRKSSSQQYYAHAPLASQRPNK